MTGWSLEPSRTATWFGTHLLLCDLRVVCCLAASKGLAVAKILKDFFGEEGLV